LDISEERGYLGKTLEVIESLGARSSAPKSNTTMAMLAEKHDGEEQAQHKWDTDLT
jgi:hypothetical protein